MGSCPKKPRIKLKGVAKKRLREYVLARDKRCLICGSRQYLNPYCHVVRRSQGGDDSPRNIITLCQVGPDHAEGCHPRFDKYEISLPESVFEMLAGEPEERW